MINEKEYFSRSSNCVTQNIKTNVVKRDGTGQNFEMKFLKDILKAEIKTKTTADRFYFRDSWPGCKWGFIGSASKMG